MRLYLINPRNPMVAGTHYEKNRFSKYRVWKPLGLLVVARLTPPDWEVVVLDENRGVPDYAALPRPDLVGLTAFTSQATRAYEIADAFRAAGVPVVMGGIHATMRRDEALAYADAVVTHEAESVWAQVTEDVSRGALRRIYTGGLVDIDQVPPARHDLLPEGYVFGSIETTRGCPFNCHFCSVTAFHGNQFRLRPIEDVVEEFKLIREKLVLIVDDNLCGTSRRHIERTKALFRAMIAAKLRKRWMCQVTLHMGEDEELVRLAAKAGCFGVFIGYETVTDEGLREVNKRFNIRKVAAIRAAVRRLQRHGIVVMGSFIFGLDADRRGVGMQIANAAEAYGLDAVNMMFLTPLPGTRLWANMEDQGRIAANRYPHDWQYYCLNLPVAHHLNLSWPEMVEEYLAAFRTFYSYRNIARRLLRNLVYTRNLFTSLGSLVTNLMCRWDFQLDVRRFQGYDLRRGAVAFALRQTAASDRAVSCPAGRVLPVPAYAATGVGGPLKK